MKRVKNSRIKLWAHLVSEHAIILDINVPLAELTEMHEHEHKGPGTIRSHDEKERSYSLAALGSTLVDEF